MKRAEKLLSEKALLIQERVNSKSAVNMHENALVNPLKFTSANQMHSSVYISNRFAKLNYFVCSFNPD